MMTNPPHSCNTAVHATHLFLAVAMALCMTGCIPEDHILRIEFSPDATKLAFISQKKGLNVITLNAGESKTLARENVCGSAFAWNKKSDEIAFVQKDNGAWNIVLTDMDGVTSAITSGYAKCRAPWFESDDCIGFLSSEKGREESRVVNLRTGKIQVGRPSALRRDPEKQRKTAEASARLAAPDGFSVSVPTWAPGNNDFKLGFALQSQLLALGDPVRRKSKILTFDLQDKFVLAEEYYQKGFNKKSLALYNEIAASVRETYDPLFAHFVCLCNLWRLGHAKEAAEGLRKMIGERTFPDEAPERYFWRVLGYCYCFGLGDENNARNCLQRFQELSEPTVIDSATSETVVSAGAPGFARDVLTILNSRDRRIAELLRAAVCARLNGDAKTAIPAFVELIKRAPAMPEVRRIYLTAMEGFDQEVYFFSPSQRPFNPTAPEKALFFERFVALAPDDPAKENIELELFSLCIQNGMFSRARALLKSALWPQTHGEFVSESAAAFLDWIESPENQPWLGGAMREVYLHPTIKDELLKRLNDPGAQMLAHIAAAKLALVDGDSAGVARAGNAATTSYNAFTSETRDAATETRFARLLAIRGMDAAQHGEFETAADWFERAMKQLRQSHADEFELYMEAKYHCDLINYYQREDPVLLRRLIEIGKESGDDLATPTWDSHRLERGINRLAALNTSTRSASGSEPVAAYARGILYDKLNRPEEARDRFLDCVETTCPGFLKAKALFELGVHDENNEDPWNAARWLEQLSSLPDADDYMKPWLSFKVAELHLKQGYKTQEAKEALAAIVSLRGETPLGIQAKELLDSLH